MVDTYDLSVAFYEKLIALSYSGTKTLLPDEIFDPAEETSATKVRRGVVLPMEPEFAGFGNGRMARLMGDYQIDIWVPRKTTSAIKTLKQMSDAHVNHFYPTDARGLTITENDTSAHILKRPTQRPMGRDGAYLREIVEVPFFVDVFASA